MSAVFGVIDLGGRVNSNRVIEILKKPFSNSFTSKYDEHRRRKVNL